MESGDASSKQKTALLAELGEHIKRKNFDGARQCLGQALHFGSSRSEAECQATASTMLPTFESEAAARAMIEGGSKQEGVKMLGDVALKYLALGPEYAHHVFVQISGATSLGGGAETEPTAGRSGRTEMGTFQTGGYSGVGGYSEEALADDAPLRRREESTGGLQRHVSLVSAPTLEETIKIPCTTAVSSAFWELSGGFGVNLARSVGGMDPPPWSSDLQEPPPRSSTLSKVDGDTDICQVIGFSEGEEGGGHAVSRYEVDAKLTMPEKNIYCHAVVVACTGSDGDYGGPNGLYERLAPILRNEGVSLLIIDSPLGRVDLQQRVVDVSAVLDWLRHREDLGAVMLLGWGMSAAACVEAASEWVNKTGNASPSVIGVCLLGTQEYGTQNAGNLGGAGIEVHVVHGSADERVPPQAGLRVWRRCVDPRKMSPMLNSGHECEEAMGIVADWVQGMVPRADLIVRRRAWEAERERLEVYVRMHEHDRLMGRMGSLTPRERARIEQDGLWLRRPGVSGNSASHWQRGHFRITGGAVFEAELHGKAKPASKICSVENVFDIKPLDPEGFPERIERYSEELKSFEYRFTPCVFSLKWARVGSDAPKGGRGGGAAQGHAETAEAVIAAENPESCEKWVAVFRDYIRRQEAADEGPASE